MIVSPTEIQAYLRCRRLWDLTSTNRQRLQPIVPGGPFSLGRGIHEGLADWLENPTNNPVERFMIASATMMQEAEEAYRKQTGTRISDSELAPLTGGVRLGTAMLNNYVKFWKTPLPDTRYDLVAPEQELVVAIPRTPHFLKMKLDAIIQNAERHLYIVDHKTYATRPREDTLRYDFQFTSYVWGAKQTGLTNVIGVAYDGLWKREEIPQGKKLSDLFMRLLIKPGVDELHEHEQMLIGTVNEMANDPFINKNWKSDCLWTCDMRSLCLAMTRGEDTDYVKQRYYSVRPERAASELLKVYD